MIKANDNHWKTLIQKQQDADIQNNNLDNLIVHNCLIGFTDAERERSLVADCHAILARAGQKIGSSISYLEM